MKNLQLVLALLLMSFSFSAQDLAMNTSVNYNNSSSYDIANYPVAPLLEKTIYTYRYKGEDVLVVFSKDEHIEYFNNKQYFIKSKIEWTANNRCFMTIKESNLPNFPFRSGSKLYMKITKIKRGYVFYESTLGGRTWLGKMKKLQ